MQSDKKVVELNLEEVLPNRFQPRIKFNEDSINELATSIKKYGVIQPIVVRKIGDKYEIIAGERRYKASHIAGKKTIPAIICDLNDKDSIEIALLENVQREDLTPIEKAISYKKILDMGYTNQETLAEKIGKSQSAIANTLRLLNLTDEVQEALLETKISERHARSLLKIKDEKKQVIMLNKIINERLTVRKTDEEIEKMLNQEDIKDDVVLSGVNQTNNDNYVMPGFMDIDRIENEAQDINKEEPKLADINSLLEPSPVTTSTAEDDSIQSGRFFNLFEDKDNQELEQLLSGKNEFAASAQDIVGAPSFEVPTQEQAVPEFNFDTPVEAPKFEMPSFEVPTQEQAVPEFNFDTPVEAPKFEMPSFEVPTQEQVVPEFNFDTPVEAPKFEMPSFEMPAQEQVVPEFNFDTPVEAPKFEMPSFEMPAQEQVVPEFNFDTPIEAPKFEMPSFEMPAQEQVVPEFNFDTPIEAPKFEMPSFEMPAQEQVVPEFNFDTPIEAPKFEMPSFEMPTQEQAVPEFNFDTPVEAPKFEMPSFEVPTQEQAVPEFNFDTPVEAPKFEMPSFEVPTQEQAVPEFNFDTPVEAPKFEMPSFEMPAQEQVVPEFNFDTPVEAPKFEMPSFEMPAQEQAVPEFNFDNNNFSLPSKNINAAIDTIRNCEEALQKLGFIVEVDENDSDGNYQVTFRVNK